MDLIERIHESQERWDVLRHPFYDRWDAGTLTRGELQVYAGQYRHAVAALADAAQAAASPEDAEHAAEEAAHVTLWDAWATSLGAEPSAPSPETATCASTWARTDALEATAVLYALESAQPAIAETKLRGLLAHYGYRDDSPALTYFHVHSERDHEHAARARAALEAAPRDAETDERLAAAADSALEGNWLLLDGVERLNSH